MKTEFSRRHFAMMGALAPLFTGCNQVKLNTSPSETEKALVMPPIPPGFEFNKPLRGARISDGKRDVCLDEDGGHILFCEKYFDEEEVIKRNQEICLLSLSQQSKIILRFPQFHIAYGAAMSEDGKYLACCVQSFRGYNYMLVIDRRTFKVVEVIHEKFIYFFMPIFIDNILHYFKSDFPSEFSLVTRNRSATTESAGADETFRFYSRKDKTETLILNHEFYVPKWVRTAPHFNGLIVGREHINYTNHNISQSDPCLFDLQDKSGNRIVQIHDHDSLSFIDGTDQKSFFSTGRAQEGLLSLDVGIEEVFEVLKRTSVSSFNGALYYSANNYINYPNYGELKAKGAIEALKIKATIDYQYDINKYYNSANLITSNKKNTLFSANDEKAKIGEQYLLVVCDQNMAIKHSYPYYKKNIKSETIDVFVQI